MKMDEVVEVWLHVFSTSAVSEYELFKSPAALLLGEQPTLSMG
jgi:hypothetical protein